MTDDISPGLAQRIRDGAEWAEAHRDDPVEDDTPPTRPGHARSVVFSLRLNPDEFEVINTLAGRLGVPASSLARGWILDGIDKERDQPDLRTALDRLAADIDRVRALAK